MSSVWRKSSRRGVPIAQLLGSTRTNLLKPKLLKKSSSINPLIVCKFGSQNSNPPPLISLPWKWSKKLINRNRKCIELKSIKICKDTCWVSLKLSEERILVFFRDSMVSNYVIVEVGRKGSIISEGIYLSSEILHSLVHSITLRMKKQ